MSKFQINVDFPSNKAENLNSSSPLCNENELVVSHNNFSLTLNQLSELVMKTPDDILLFILSKKFNFLSLIKERDAKQDLISYAIIALGKACSSKLRKDLNNLLLSISSEVNNFLINIQQYLVSLKRQEITEKIHLDSLFYLTVFLRNFQLTLPSSSLDFISMILPLITLTCKKQFKDQEELGSIVSEKLKEIDDELKLFTKHFSVFEIKNATEKEKLHMLEPPENFRSLSVLPTLDDILLPCSFLRPNIVKGKYKSAEHYLDVQFRLLREDYIKPLRDGIAEYLCLKRDNKSFKSCKSVQVYSNVSIFGEEFANGDLIHTIKFDDKHFASINWENSKRLLTGSLVCLSSDDFHSILFATVLYRDLKDLKENGLLRIRFEKISDAALNLTRSVNFVMIETTTYFESYCHTLKALQTVNGDLLPMKRYIVDVEKIINCPRYLLPTTTFDLRPLLIPLNKEFINQVSSRRFHSTVYNYPDNVISIAKSITLRDDNCWPSACDLNLDQSQLDALKSAVTKEFAIIQGPPGTGKTYVGLRVVQLLLHNIDRWFSEKTNSLPILIVCYTNHALDQFLEGVLLFTENIVRIGGRGTNETVAEFQISNLIDYRFFSQDLKEAISETVDEIKTIKGKIDNITKNIEDSSKYLIRQSDIEDYIPSVHLQSLKRGDFRQNYKLRHVKNTIKDWLCVDDINETLCKEELHYENISSQLRISKTNEEVENESEADVEFIENQRNIDVYDFEKREVLMKSEQNDWKHQEKSKLNLKCIKNMLEQNVAMKSHQAMKIKNIWMLHKKARWQLYKFWLEIFIEEQQKGYMELQAELKKALKEKSNLYAERDFRVIRGSHIVGMTTTGAAKYKHIVEAMKPAVLIVEEAAEILESHIISSLVPETQHVILIGDQQQLRPSPSVYMLAVKYNMNVSLFERMIKNGVDYCRLSIQHRMRPEIASLIVPHIYSDLKNHEVVTKFDNIKGVAKNMFFITHNFSEMFVKDSKSKVNEHEAKFLIKLCKYLILQGYEPSRITVLTTYLGQLFVLKRLATDDEVKEVRFTVVDNFQGEENDIILISFVRSNNEGEVGFLKVPNRVCVALSRAKKGLYCIGNFELLAEKSKLWKNIVQTLTVNQSIGPSLQLMCQNHPDVVNEVVNDVDFSAVPDGGCTQKCEYRLPCGHACSLFCHPYDQAHELFDCKKPCNFVCKEGHQCPKRCFENCKPCPIIIDRTLKCGHNVSAACGLDESEIDCLEPCIKTCDKGHTCPEKCFEYRTPCPVIDKTFKRRHHISAAFGLDESEIDCLVPSMKICDNRHTCPKKCVKNCKPCQIIIDRTLKCGHNVSAKCGLEERKIRCLEPCIKTCNKGHTCPKKCSEYCKPCPIIIDKTLKCGHTVPAACGLVEWKIECPEPCSKTCDKGHKCPKKCFERCGLCKTLVDKILKKCGHTVQTYCGERTFSEEMIKCKNQCSKTCKEGHQCVRKCYEKCGPCTFIVDKTLSQCGHIVKVPCSKDVSKIKCNMKCSKILPCGHECSNKCYEPCILKCVQGIEIKSPICGHVLEVECGFTESFEELQEICSNSCNKVLPCGHMCKGTCGTCYQGRLHVECQEACKRVLICGHKCNSKCSKSCPPCEEPCENWCSHGKCPRKCGSPCVKCFKKCDWFCSHKKCTRCCYEICDRKPCNEPCMKKLPCKHPCVGFCGEPCPKWCRICDEKRFNKDVSRFKIEDYGIYIYLEDCKHAFKECDLNKWLNSSTQGFQKIEMKTCPECNTVIRKNVRFNTLIKTCIADIEKVKLIAMYDKEENLKIQKSLLKHPKLSYMNHNDYYKHLIKFISSENVRNIQELLIIGNIINFAVDIESKRYGIFSMFVLRPSLESLVHYARFCRMWLNDFICNNFHNISEYQVLQLSDEVYRLNLIDLLLKFASEKFFVATSPDFENCVQCVVNFKPFSENYITEFEIAFQSMIKNSFDNFWNVPAKNTAGLTFVNMSGNWYQCPNGSIRCFIDDSMFVKNNYECTKNKSSNKIKFLATYNNVSGSNMLSNNKLCTKHDLTKPSELQSTSTASIHDIGQDESARLVNANASKHLSTFEKSEDTCDQNTEGLNTEYDNRDHGEFLLSLLLKKLQIMCKVQQARFDKGHRINNNSKQPSKKDKVSDNATFTFSLLYQNHATEQQTTKLQLCEGIKQRDCSGMSEDKNSINKKNDASFLNKAKGTGAVPKNPQIYHNFHHMRRGQNKYRNWFDDNFQNPSRYPSENKAYHEGGSGNYSKTPFNHITAKETITSKYSRGRYCNQGSVKRSELQNSSQSIDNISKSSKYCKGLEEGYVNKSNVNVFSNNIRTREANSRSTSRPYQGRHIHRGQTDIARSRSSGAEDKEYISDSVKYDKPFKENCIKKSDSSEVLSNDIKAVQNANKITSRPYRGHRGKRRPGAKFRFGT